MARREVLGLVTLIGADKLMGKTTTFSLKFAMPVQMKDFKTDEMLNELGARLMVALNDAADGPVAVEPTWDIQWDNDNKQLEDE